MSACTSKIDSTLTGGQAPPRCLTGNIIPMITLSRRQLEIELELIGDNLNSAAMYIQLSSTFRAETRIARAKERLDKLLAAIKGEDDAHLHMLREQVPNASRGLY